LGNEQNIILDWLHNDQEFCQKYDGHHVAISTRERHVLATGTSPEKVIETARACNIPFILTRVHKNPPLISLSKEKLFLNKTGTAL
jgi:hypothetical protein